MNDVDEGPLSLLAIRSKRDFFLLARPLIRTFFLFTAYCKKTFLINPYFFQ